MLKKATGDISEKIIKPPSQIEEDVNDGPELKKNRTTDQEKDKKGSKEALKQSAKGKEKNRTTEKEEGKKGGEEALKQSAKSKEKNKTLEETPEPILQQNSEQPIETDLAAFTDLSETLPEEGLFVEYAGLVLLHPFFRFLFKNICLTEEGNFISREK